MITIRPISTVLLVACSSVGTPQTNGPQEKTEPRAESVAGSKTSVSTEMRSASSEPDDRDFSKPVAVNNDRHHDARARFRTLQVNDDPYEDPYYDSDESRLSCRAIVYKSSLPVRTLMPEWAISSTENLANACAGYYTNIVADAPARIAISIPIGLATPDPMDGVDFVRTDSVRHALKLRHGARPVVGYIDMSDEDGLSCSLYVFGDEESASDVPTVMTVWQMRADRDDGMCLFWRTIIVL